MPAARRPGRRPGESRTRADILAAARTQFADSGYDAASVRRIARAADVDPALVMHYFGSKPALFAAALEIPFRPEEITERVLDGPRDEIGHRLVRFFLSNWEDRERRDALMALLRAATTSSDAAAMLRERIGERVLMPVGAHLGVADAPLRMSLCGSHLVGMAMARYIVQIEPLASIDADTLAELVAPTLQRYLTGSLEI